MSLVLTDAARDILLDLADALEHTDGPVGAVVVNATESDAIMVSNVMAEFVATQHQGTSRVEKAAELRAFVRRRYQQGTN